MQFGFRNVDDRLTFTVPVNNTCEKLVIAINTIAKIRLNVGGLWSSMTRCLVGIAT